MKLRLLSIFAAIVLVSACAADGAGNQNTASTGSAPTTETGAGAMTGIIEATGTDRVFFDYDQSAVRADARGTLDAWAAWLKANAGVGVTIEGHCDERGTSEYNLALGERRANAVRDYLVSQGVGADRINTISYGKERPADAGSNEAAWAKNRRGVVVQGMGS